MVGAEVMGRVSTYTPMPTRPTVAPQQRGDAPHVEYTDQGQAVVRGPHVFVPYGSGELCDVCGQVQDHRLHGDDYTRRIAQLTPYFAIRNARRLLSRRYAKSPNWVLAMEIFGLGSTYASRLCRDNGLDPDGVA
jgi:hypothetical protein